MRAKTEEEMKVVHERMDRRATKQVIGFMPAIPLYAFSIGVPEDGVLLRYLFPMSGRITKLYISILGSSPQKTLSIRAELSGPTTGQYVEGVLRKDLTILSADLHVEAGSRLTVLAAASWDGPIEVAAIFNPTMGLGEVYKARNQLESPTQGEAVTEEPTDEGA